MINKELLNPQSIVVVGGSNDITKPGGKVLKNIIDGSYKGKLYTVNPKETEIQGQECYKTVNDLPNVDLAVIAISAKFTLDAVTVLVKEKKTKAFIILSAGFSEESHEGKLLEGKIVEIINSVDGALIGPNCIGVITPNHHSVFTKPIPNLNPFGCDFISGSGATAAFTLEASISKGLTFANIFSVGNSAQIGVEDVLKYMDETFDAEKSSRIKLLYLENINNPKMLLKHASSLIEKGCKIAAIKAGTSEAGSRAASSHTGALASPDVAVDALFRKAGIIRCYGRDDLATTASIFTYPEMKGKNIAIITHAGGPAVMLTDILSNGGLSVPHLSNGYSEELLTHLFSGSSVSNPIDILATGTAEQLGLIIDYCNLKFDNIDGMVVIFGTPGLSPVFDVYDLLHEKMITSKKPIYPILPSLQTAKEEIKDFVSKGHAFFPDEVLLGNAIAKIYNTTKVSNKNICLPMMDQAYSRAIIDSAEDGYLSPVHVQALLDAAGIPRAGEAIVNNTQKAIEEAERLGFPVVMKVVGPVHKSDVGGVVLNVLNVKAVENEFIRMMQIPETTAVLIQPMLSGIELYVGAKKEDKFGHLVLCGLGGIFIEVLKDVSSGLCPISKEEGLSMIQSLKGYKILEGVRGQEGVDIKLFSEIISRVSALVTACPEIVEMDINPLLGKGNRIIAVDARIRIEKNK